MARLDLLELDGLVLQWREVSHRAVVARRAGKAHADLKVDLDRLAHVRWLMRIGHAVAIHRHLDALTRERALVATLPRGVRAAVTVALLDNLGDLGASVERNSEGKRIDLQEGGSVSECRAIIAGSWHLWTYESKRRINHVVPELAFDSSEEHNGCDGQ